MNPSTAMVLVPFAVDPHADTLAEIADFDGVQILPNDVSILALYWALALYDPDIKGGGRLEIETIEK